MYLMYADESGNTGTDLDNKSQPNFTIAGILIKDTDWYVLNYLFQKRKIEICPELKSSEVHTSDIFSSSKSKRKGYDFRKYSLSEILSILESLVDFIVEHKIQIIAAPMTKQGFKKYCLEHFGSSFKVDPYLYNFARLSNEYNNFLIKNNSNGMIFVDEIQDKMLDVNLMYEKLFLNNFECNTNNIIEKVVYTHSDDNNFIQLADICAFYINKLFCIKLYGLVKNEKKRKHCINMYDKLKPLIINCINHDIVDNFFIQIKNEQEAILRDSVTRNPLPPA